MRLAGAPGIQEESSEKQVGYRACVPSKTCRTQSTRYYIEATERTTGFNDIQDGAGRPRKRIRVDSAAYERGRLLQVAFILVSRETPPRVSNYDEKNSSELTGQQEPGL